MLLIFILENFILQLVFFVGAITLIGLAVGKLNDKFLELSGKTGFKIMLVSGAVGTPVHELGHAVMCLIFGHKIVAMKLFDPKASGGKLGYVSHSYNKRNLYHRAGNFFIGVGPIILGGAVLLLLMLVFVPGVFSAFGEKLSVLGEKNLSAFSGETYTALFKAFAGALASVFAPQNFLNFFFWLFLILSASIAMHMKISASDIKSGVSGFFFLAFVFFVVDVILALVYKPLVSGFTSVMFRAGVFVICFLSLAVILSLALVLIALICKGILRLRKPRRRY